MPLTKLEKLPDTPFASLDTETIPYNNLEVTWLVTFTREDESQVYFLIDPELFFLNYEEALNKLWFEVFSYLTLFYKGDILVHNLGSFDGYFIYKQASVLFPPHDVDALVDPQNKFITIGIDFENWGDTEDEWELNKIKFKDSMRQFPIGLDQFCKIYKVPGKLSKFNKAWHDPSILYNWNILLEAIKYGLQDSLCLMQAYKNARNATFENYKVDIFKSR